ncbi:MAG TPA: TIGR03619 family F420-dependent LLM class oxidoreductase [Acidimicrobiia bacterium]|nr:TIGR03619 family F420-dependent LLM class oxidoreductase [Acidimicrobiia bacterium]
MKLGIGTPVLTLLPRAHARWEETATFDDVIAIVQEAERLGYHHCTCSEHVAVPVDVAAVRGGRYFDPLATFGALGHATATIRFAAHVGVLGYHHPLAIAKRYGTLDVVTGGRVILGVGVGSLREEFDLLGAPFDDRGARADDAMRALRSALSQPEPEYHGTYVDFEGFLVDPSAVQPHVPMWVGGRTFRSLRRAVELGDGWAPFGLRTAELEEMLHRAGRPDRPFDVIVQNEHPLDPLTEPDRVADQLRRFSGIGATGVNVRFVHHSRDHYCEQLAALADVAASV